MEVREKPVFSSIFSISAFLFCSSSILALLWVCFDDIHPFFLLLLCIFEEFFCFYKILLPENSDSSSMKEYVISPLHGLFTLACNITAFPYSTQCRFYFISGGKKPSIEKCLILALSELRRQFFNSKWRL